MSASPAQLLLNFITPLWIYAGKLLDEKNMAGVGARLVDKMSLVSACGATEQWMKQHKALRVHVAASAEARSILYHVLTWPCMARIECMKDV